ncbi:MAG: hypothetical protein M1830_007782 [Pleopsidium flavum]|nr:MAG: hypothetical protein M1830_007782 [Pleopsidium flavum]
MPTPLDRALQSRNAFLGFAGIVTAVAAWTIWGSDMFPAEKDPIGGNQPFIPFPQDLPTLTSQPSPPTALRLQLYSTDVTD